MVPSTQALRKRSPRAALRRRRGDGAGPRLILLPLSAWTADRLRRGLDRGTDVLMWSLAQYPGAQRWAAKP